MLADIYRDVVYAVRTLIKSPSFTAVAIFALALGIGANTTVYSVVNALLNFPIPMERPRARDLHLQREPGARGHPK